MMMNKKFIVLLMAGLISTGVEAKLGNSSYSSSKSSYSSYRSKPSSFSSSSSYSSRLGGGKSIGESRSSVMNSIRNPSPSYENNSGTQYQRVLPSVPASAPPRTTTSAQPQVATVTAPAPQYRSQQYHNNDYYAGNNHQGNGNGLSTVIAAGLVANAINANSNKTTVIVQQPQSNTVTLPTANNVPIQESHYNSNRDETDKGASAFMIIMVLLTLFGLIFVLAKWYIESKKSDGTKNEDNKLQKESIEKDEELKRKLASEAVQMYIEFQELNNKGDILALNALTGSVIFEMIKQDIENRTEVEEVKIRQIQAKLVYFENMNNETGYGEQYKASIQYQGVLLEEGNEVSVDEVYHFTKNAEEPQWRLMGIESV